MYDREGRLYTTKFTKPHDFEGFPQGGETSQKSGLNRLLGPPRGRPAHFAEHHYVVGNGPRRVADRPHAAPLAVDRAVLAPRPGAARPVALALHRGVKLVEELRRLQRVADGLLGVAEHVLA